MKHIILTQKERNLLLEKIDLRLADWIHSFPDSKNVKRLKIEIGFSDIYLNTIMILSNKFKKRGDDKHVLL